ncbi:hypothetical protein ROZALSC1DRAFT_28143 [Rozella allomycis CSF55]|uniref:Uncharacterized protein n=1 Tax=Rozella allomycis (strain CSF55) TaxID=988480 RepID=A0A4P9YN12_ROZAC|nr:hypothetical protein ROZALSC1DRAFT_28143 [Rozella allomycis CSF55]
MSYFKSSKVSVHNSDLMVELLEEYFAYFIVCGNECRLSVLNSPLVVDIFSVHVHQMMASDMILFLLAAVSEFWLHIEDAALRPPRLMHSVKLFIQHLIQLDFNDMIPGSATLKACLYQYFVVAFEHADDVEFPLLTWATYAFPANLSQEYIHMNFVFYSVITQRIFVHFIKQCEKLTSSKKNPNDLLSLMAKLLHILSSNEAVVDSIRIMEDLACQPGNEISNQISQFEGSAFYYKRFFANEECELDMETIELSSSLIKKSIPLFAESDKGLLTQQGKNQLKLGARKCSNKDLVPRYNAEKLIIQTHEIAILAQFLYSLSEEINGRVKSKIRLNLWTLESSK